MAQKITKDLTQDRLKELLHYDPATGEFTWKQRKGAARKGLVANSKRAPGYRHITIDYVRYATHRLAWFYVHGEWPNVIDHADGNKANNAIANLRNVDYSGNNQNKRAAQSNNKSGLLGVAKSSSLSRPWRANIRIGGKQVHLGCFKTPELAYEAYLTAKRGHHECNTL